MLWTRSNLDDALKARRQTEHRSGRVAVCSEVGWDNQHLSSSWIPHATYLCTELVSEHLQKVFLPLHLEGKTFISTISVPLFYLASSEPCPGLTVTWQRRGDDGATLCPADVIHTNAQIHHALETFCVSKTLCCSQKWIFSIDRFPLLLPLFQR